MVKLAVLSAWAELQIKSTRSEYLVGIIVPHIRKLIAMWLDTLTSYAKLQFEPDVGDGTAVEELVIESQYPYVSKEFLLKVCIYLSSLINRFTYLPGFRYSMPLRC